MKKFSREDIAHLAENLVGTDDNLVETLQQLSIYREWPTEFDEDGDVYDYDSCDEEGVEGIFGYVRYLLWRYERVCQCRQSGEWQQKKKKTPTLA